VATAERAQPLRLQLRTYLTGGDFSPRPRRNRSGDGPAAPCRVVDEPERECSSRGLNAQNTHRMRPAGSAGSSERTRGYADRMATDSSRPAGRRRDRRGRGLRGELAPRGVPLARTRSEEFDDLILDAVEDLERSWSAELADVEFAVEDVPTVAGPTALAAEFDPEVIDDHGIPLGRLVRPVAGSTNTGSPGGSGKPAHPVIVIYRRPLESRAHDRDDRADLVFSVVAELVAEALGKDVDEIDPPR
jgi:hypothetical protein